MAYNKSERPDSPMKRRGGRRRKKVCVFCGKENKLCKTSESSDSSYQESTSHRSYAIRSGLIKI